MKRVLFLVAILCSMASCRQGNAVQKPQNLIEEEQMVNMLYDLSLLQSAYAVSSPDLQNKRIDGKEFLKAKYGVDSITFAKSHKYYAAQPESYQKMQRKVAERMEAEKLKLSKAKPATAAEKKLQEIRTTK